MNRTRLDIALVERGLMPSRARARDAILRGCVRIDMTICEKPGQLVGGGAELSIDDPAKSYVSRAAIKLIAGLDQFDLDPSGLTALDIGASTGGFTQVLLERRAHHVIAVDVGHDQMSASIRRDPRVSLLEGLNARDLQRHHLGGRPVGAIVCDVSFISIKIALPTALSLAAPGAWGLFLVKPQFEVGRKNIGRGGLVRSAKAAADCVQEVAGWLSAIDGWRVLGHAPAPLTGSKGNQEFLLAAGRIGDDV